MPMYDFRCLNKKCNKQYEDLAAHDETGKYPTVVCPHCNSKKKEVMITGISFAFSNPEGTDRWNNLSTGHDYRFKHNIPKVKAERAMAEAMSHMGATPYEDFTEKDLQLDTGIHDAETRQGLS